MKFNVVNDFFEKMVDRLNQSSDHGYPHDILIDCTELMNTPDDNTVLLFVKGYISTGMITLQPRSYKYDEIKNEIGLINHYLREIDSYKTVYVFFGGSMSERDISVTWCREYILDVMWFFANKSVKRLWDLSDLEKDTINQMFEETERIYAIRKKECRSD